MNLKRVPCSVDEFNRFKLGDEAAFRNIFNHYKPIIFSKIKALCSSDFDAEEILQEVFIQLFQKRQDIPNIESIFPFLYVVAKRQAISIFRKEVVRQQFQLSQQSQWNEAHENLDKKIESKDLVLFLQEVIAKLPAMQQRVFRMSKMDELSYAEISEQMGISKNTVRNHLVTAYQFVRLRMENKLFLFFF